MNGQEKIFCSLERKPDLSCHAGMDVFKEREVGRKC